MDKIMKAVEFDKLPAKFKKAHPGGVEELWRSGDYFMFPKYDGCYGIFVKTGDTVVGYTRTWEVLKSCDHIATAISHEFREYANCYIIGELWAEHTDFPIISGLVRRHYAAPELQLVIHDFVVGQKLNSDEPFHSRIERVASHMGGPYSTLRVAYKALPYGKVGCFESALEYANNLKSLGGYDGAVLKHKDRGYTQGLVKQGEIIKVKPSLTLDLEAVSYAIEPGEKTGRPVVTIQVRYRGVMSKVGSGIPHTLQGPEVLGKVVEIECMGLTADGKLREARFKAIRNDKTIGECDV